MGIDIQEKTGRAPASGCKLLEQPSSALPDIRADIAPPAINQ
jgi:hypothetical protein